MAGWGGGWGWGAQGLNRTWVEADFQPAENPVESCITQFLAQKVRPDVQPTESLAGLMLYISASRSAGRKSSLFRQTPLISSPGLTPTPNPKRVFAPTPPSDGYVGHLDLENAFCAPQALQGLRNLFYCRLFRKQTK